MYLHIINGNHRTTTSTLMMASAFDYEQTSAPMTALALTTTSNNLMMESRHQYLTTIAQYIHASRSIHNTYLEYIHMVLHIYVHSTYIIELQLLEPYRQQDSPWNQLSVKHRIVWLQIGASTNHDMCCTYLITTHDWVLLTCKQPALFQSTNRSIIIYGTRRNLNIIIQATLC